MTQDKQLRIGIDASNLLRGGGITHIVEILNVLKPSVHGISNVTVWGGQAILSKIKPRSWLKLIHIPEIDASSRSRLFWQNKTLTKEAKKECDVLFVPGGIYLGGFRPFVTMSRNLLPFDPEERRRFGLSLTRARYHLLEYGQAKTFSNAAGVIFLTETHQKKVMQRLRTPPTASIVIPHGTSDYFDSAPRKTRALSEVHLDAPFRWLYVSIVNLYKHQWHVAEATALLRQEGFPVSLDLIGPSHQPALDRLSQTLSKLDDKKEFIRYLGAVPYSELKQYYQQADGFIFASSCETFGQILTEAMRSGLPIACANRSAMPDVLQDAGVYFDPEDPASIASAMKGLMKDHEMRSEYAHKAYVKAKALTWDRCANDTFSFITRVLRKKVGHSITDVAAN